MNQQYRANRNTTARSDGPELRSDEWVEELWRRYAEAERSEQRLRNQKYALDQQIALASAKRQDLWRQHEAASSSTEALSGIGGEERKEGRQ